MPAIITHHVFGEEAVTSLPDGLIESQEELLAFLLGNQGPDPFFARFTTIPPRIIASNRLGTAMHSHHVVDALIAARNAAGRLGAADARIGRAFVMGFASHYVLDSTAHPFIFAQQYDIIAADPELEGSGSEVHSVIESDIDSWVSWQSRHATVIDNPPALELARTTRIELVAGAILSHVALSVYGIRIGVGEYGAAVRDFETLYRLVEPATSTRAHAIGLVERIFRQHSRVESMAHYPTTSDECPAANLERRTWTNPFTGETSHDSFADRFDIARMRWPEFCEAMVAGDRERLETLAGGINYDGQPTDS